MNEGIVALLALMVWWTCLHIGDDEKPWAATPDTRDKRKRKR